MVVKVVELAGSGVGLVFPHGLVLVGVVVLTIMSVSDSRHVNVAILTAQLLYGLGGFVDVPGLPSSSELVYEYCVASSHGLPLLTILVDDPWCRALSVWLAGSVAAGISHL